MSEVEATTAVVVYCLRETIADELVRLRKKGTHLCIEFIYCHCAGRPFRRIPLLISSTGPTASKSHQATTYL